MNSTIQLFKLKNFPLVNEETNLAATIIDNILNNNIQLQNNDILCIASKVVSISEKRIVDLNTISPSKLAYQLHKSLPRKDVRAIQVIIEQTQDPTGNRLQVKPNYIGAWLPNGLKLTSGGVDKIDDAQGNKVILLPIDANISAQEISLQLKIRFAVDIGVVITDSDGREDKVGSTQVAIGCYGVPAIRCSNYVDSQGNNKVNQETICDMLAAASALIMGQRGTGSPVVLIRGVDYIFSAQNSLKNALISKHM